jgi:hypothetical protein
MIDEKWCTDRIHSAELAYESLDEQSRDLFLRRKYWEGYEACATTARQHLRNQTLPDVRKPETRADGQLIEEILGYVRYNSSVTIGDVVDHFLPGHRSLPQITDALVVLLQRTELPRLEFAGGNTVMVTSKKESADG